MMQRRRSRGVIAMWLPALALIVMLAGACSLRTSSQSAATRTPATATPTPGSEGPNTVQATAAPGLLAISEVAERVRPAVVQVTNQRQVGAEQFRQPVPETAGIGSGVIYDPSGLILTNEHVVAGADSLVVGLPDGRSFSATIVGADPQTDLAVIRIDGGNLPVARLGSAATLAVGDVVVAIGNALGLAGGPTVTQGIVSALGRAIPVPSPSDRPEPGTPSPGPQAGTFLFDLIQTDAPINPGNSGGPLVNLQAEVVGVNTLVAESTRGGVAVEGIGFAISVDTAKRIAGQLVSSGKAVHPFLGVEYVALNPALAARLNAPVQRGALVTNVQPSSPAARARIRQDDIIISANGQELQAESSLAEIVDEQQPGATLDLTILRNGQRQSVRVTLGQRP